MQLSAGFVSAHLFVEYGFSFGFVVVCAVAVLMVFQVKLLKIYDIQRYIMSVANARLRNPGYRVIFLTASCHAL